ncbi:MAG: ABC transporter substrate-binding protein, partial [Microbacteriaceae bacterium]|nr:ABC transporter substrate-binding protein [Microbacteriaceae bacterium]
QTLFGYEGKALSVPIGSVAIGAVYNDQTLAEIGATIPETLPEVLDYCAAATAAGKVGYALFQQGGSVLTSYALSASLVYGPNPGFTAEQVAGDASFADSGWRDVLDVQVQMLEAGCFNESPNGTDFTAAAQLIADGSAVGVVAFTDVSGFTAVAPEGTTFSMGPVPATSSADDNYLAVANSTGFAVNAEAEEPELARAFVAFVATAEAQNAFAEATGGAPAIPNDTFTVDNQLQQILFDYVNAGKTGIWPDQEWPGGEVAQALLDASQAIFAGTMTVDEALTGMDAAFETALSNQ